MKFPDVQQWLGRLLVVYVFVVLGLPEASFGKEAAGGAPLSMTDIVKQATQQSAAGHRIERLADGRARVPSPVQAIEAVAAPEEISVASTRKDQPGSFAIRAASLGRTGSIAAPVTPGTVSVDKELARIVHPELSEELTTSADGIRQDFLIPAPPQGKGELALELSFTGAALKKSGDAVELAMPGGRKFLYRRLHVTDSKGTTLPARSELQGANRLRIVVADAGAAYPVRIDPTITDANWVSIALPGTNGSVNALFYAGGNLFVGGAFTAIGGTVAMHIAKWDGSSWSALGSGMDGMYATVNALTWDGANLYAGGDFTTAGGNSANSIAKWDGSSWSPLGSGILGSVNALAWDGANLYAGGVFGNAGGQIANCIAKWDSSTWSPLGSGMYGSVNALTWDGANLYIGGNFTTAGGVSADHIAKWNGNSWSALGSGVNGSVSALAWDGANLYAGGWFTSAGGSSANHIAKWNGSSWSPLGTGMNLAVLALFWDGANLYAGGCFTGAGGNGANSIAKWNGSSWSPLGDGMNSPAYYTNVYALAWNGTNLYAGGDFTIAGGASADHIAKWDGNSWSPMGISRMNGQIDALVWDGANLYAGGSFTIIGGIAANHIAKWDGHSWTALGSGISEGYVNALAWDGVNVYAGGYFTTAGGISANSIAKWDDSSWSPLGSGINGGEVNALLWDGTSLYAGGWFTFAGGVSANSIARWDGTSWSTPGSGMDGSPGSTYVHALAWDGTNLYAGGYFNAAGGISANHIAKWDGNSWSPLGSGLNWDNGIRALAWDGANLYAATWGGVSKWDGISWSALGSGVGGEVLTLACDGANLYAGGDFTTVGGISANYIARWDGSSWSPLGSGMNSLVYALALDGSNLYAGGHFSSAGAKPASVAYLSATVWTVKPASASASYKGGKGTITFTVSGKASLAEVTASSSDPWLAIISPSSVVLKNGKGSGKVTWSAEPNPASTLRSATITIGTQTVTITQDAAPCVVKLTPTSIPEPDNSGGAATITVTAPDACGWEVPSGTAAWINPTPLSGIGAGTITLDIGANTTGKYRRGKLTVATEEKSASVTVKQPK